MELLVASAVAAMTAAGVYLILRLRVFPVILGTAMLSYAVNIFLFAAGRLVVNMPPILDDAAKGYTDPVPQALVLTAIVISFGMTAVVVMMSLGSFILAGHDRIDMTPEADQAAERAAKRDAEREGRA
ncbi:Na+/H+ antiporter subunit C [Phaeovulum sp. W22_SRMD_FR3]|uniref:Na+/H+ antiporter subunit C n=1 Tax=Phaeovulum sp. W22_SRMD_FR3 TaxID=3240274 RepID=UPI003F943735